MLSPTGICCLAALALLALRGVGEDLRGRTRWLLIGLACFAAVAHAVAYDALRDDAFITFRYVDNLVSGRGLVFNPGERVEGYSNFLQLMLLALFHGVFGWDLVSSAVGLGAVAGVATVVGAAVLVQRLAPDASWAGVAAASGVAGASGVAAHAMCGLETSLFTALVLCTLCVAVRAATFRGAVRVGLLAGLTTMTRPDGCLLLLVLLVHAAWGRRWRVVGGLCCGAGLLLLPWTLWRWSYYGWLIPNQIAAKQGLALARQLELGAKYVIRAAVAYTPYVLAASLVGWSAWRRIRSDAVRLHSGDRLVLGVFAVYVAFPLLVGGDWMPGFRFLVPAAVVGAVLVPRLQEAVGAAGRMGMAAVSGRVLMPSAAIATAVLGSVHPNVMPEVHRLNEIVRGEIELGRWLGRSLPEGTLTAAWANGAIPFYSGLPTIDMLGLTDEHIARHGHRHALGYPGHVAHDHEDVVRRRPAVVTYLDGSGFAQSPTDFPAGFGVWPAGGYEVVSFEFVGREAPTGRFVNLWMLASERDRLVSALTDEARKIQIVRQ